MQTSDPTHAVHLVDGTYELFRAYYSKGSGHLNDAGVEVGATRRLMMSLLRLVEDGATHVAVATDHVIESFRNDLWAGYKNGDGIEPALRAQFDLAEDALRAAGFTVWPMVEVEADDALAAAAAVAAVDRAVQRVYICTPDKDLAQCVTEDGRVVQWDRRRDIVYDHAGVIEKFGVSPASIPDWLALVGDAADGFPGLPGWGAKSAATVLARYGHIEDIPADADGWDVPVRGAGKLARTLRENMADAVLFRRIATLERDLDVGTPADWRWEGPTSELATIAATLDLQDWCASRGLLAPSE